jgi:hypothetical protein
MNSKSIKESYNYFCFYYNKHDGVYKEVLKYLPSLESFFAMMKAVCNLPEYKTDYACTTTGRSIDGLEREYYRDVCLAISGEPIIGLWNVVPSPWYRKMVADITAEYQKLTAN